MAAGIAANRFDPLRQLLHPSYVIKARGRVRCQWDRSPRHAI